MIGRNQKWLFLSSVLIFGLIDRSVDGVPLIAHALFGEPQEMFAVDVITKEYEIILTNEQAPSSESSSVTDSASAKVYNFSYFNRIQAGPLDIPAKHTVLWMMQLFITDYIILFIRGYHKYINENEENAKNCARIVNFLITYIDTKHLPNYLTTIREGPKFYYQVMERAEAAGNEYTKLVNILEEVKKEYLGDDEGLYKPNSLDSLKDIYPQHLCKYLEMLMFGRTVSFLDKKVEEQQLWKKATKFKELIEKEKNVASLIQNFELSFCECPSPDFEEITELKLILTTSRFGEPVLRIVKISGEKMKYLGGIPVGGDIIPFYTSVIYKEDDGK